MHSFAPPSLAVTGAMGHQAPSLGSDAAFSVLDLAEHDPDKELQNWSSLIGIITAIVGNVLIALALNVQRYAHIRLHQERARIRLVSQRAKAAEQQAHNGTGGGSYGTAGANGNQRALGQENGDDAGDAAESAPLIRSFRSEDSTASESSGQEAKVASTYLKSPYWWMGQILITIGELGNFLAYGFAPASIVSPLGVVALISNCIIAPILFNETFRKRDFWGVVVAVGGAVTVVLSAKQEETKLDPHDVWDAITTIEFEVYLAVTMSLIILLMWASTKYGNRTILIDLGLVGLFGGYTVLATKGISSMLSSTLLGAFATPVTYGLLFILLATAVMQVRYVNKALQAFDSTQVIPIQFVMFTISVIIGSAVLYRDFQRTTTEQAIKFIGGCLLTFFGVFLITSGREAKDEEDGLSDVEGVEETIGLAEQDPTQPVGHSSASIAPRSRRSSQASRVSFVDPLSKTVSMSHDSGLPSLRIPTLTRSKPSPDSESAPLLSNPWNNSTEHVLPPPGVRTISDDSVTTIASLPSGPSTPIHTTDRPMTPRASVSWSRPQSHHFTGTLISPSPLSSTVSAVVKDTLLRNADNPLLRRSSRRGLRSSIRASLFMPDDDDEDEDEEETSRPVEATQSHEHVGRHFGDQEVEDREASPKDRARRPRSLSDTLGGFFRVKRKKKGSATDMEEGL